MDAAHDGQRIGLVLLFDRIARESCDVLRLSEDLEADSPRGHVELFDLLSQEFVHDLRTADEIGRVALRVLFDQLRGEEAALAGPVRFVAREHVDDVHAIAFQSSKLVLQNDVIRRHRAVQDRQLRVHRAVCDLLCHGRERRDADAACQRHDVMRVAERFIVELSESHIALYAIADFQFGVDVIANQPVALAAPHGDLDIPVLLPCLERRGRDRIRAAQNLAVELECERNELSRIERGQLAAADLFKAHGLCRGACGADVRDREIQRAGMPLLGDVADRVDGLRRFGSGFECVEARFGDARRAADVL